MIVSYDKLPQPMNKFNAIQPPSIEIINDHNFYMLIMYDSDAKYIHWIVINKQKYSKNGMNGETLIEYVGPNPPKGLHHYEFLLYEQNEKKDIEIEKMKQINRKTPLDSITNGLKIIDRKVFQIGGTGKLNNIKRYSKPIKWNRSTNKIITLKRSYSKPRATLKKKPRLKNILKD